MANINVEKMKLPELLELEGRVAKAIVHARDRDRAEVKRQIETLAQSAGFSVGELYGGRGRGGKTTAAKYMNPENRSETWTGRGRKPNWLTNKIGKGAKLEDFAVR